MAVTYLYDVANEILATSLAALSEDRTGNKVPQRTNVAWGVPPADSCCEDGGQLTVHLDTNPNGVAHDEPEPIRQSKIIIPRITYGISLFRCVPTVEDDGNSLPTPQQLNASGKALLSDLWALLKGLYDAIQMGELFTGVDCNSTHIVRVDPYDPSGGCAGFAIFVTILANAPGPE